MRENWGHGGRSQVLAFKVVSKFSWISERVRGIKYFYENHDSLGAGHSQLLITKATFICPI